MARKHCGRPKGSKNAVDVVVVERSHCPKCGSSRRSEYWGRMVQKCPGLRADGTPCPPTRLLIYFRHRCGNGEYDISIKGGCVFFVDLSGDGGATWGEWCEITTPADGESYPVRIEIVGPYVETFSTADFRIRFRFTGDEDADTPEWTDPGEDAASAYCGAAMIDWLSIVVDYGEFGYRDQRLAQGGFAQVGLFQE